MTTIFDSLRQLKNIEFPTPMLVTLINQLEVLATKQVSPRTLGSGAQLYFFTECMPHKYKHSRPGHAFVIACSKAEAVSSIMANAHADANILQLSKKISDELQTMFKAKIDYTKEQSNGRMSVGDYDAIVGVDTTRLHFGIITLMSRSEGQCSVRDQKAFLQEMEESLNSSTPTILPFDKSFAFFVNGTSSI